MRELKLDAQNKQVVNEVGEVVLPKFFSAEMLKEYIENVMTTHADIIRDAQEFFATYPTFEAYKAHELLLKRQDVLLARCFVSEFQTNYFVATHHPSLLTRIVESTVLENLYNVQQAVESFKQQVHYMKKYEQLISEPIQVLYEQKTFIA